MAIVEALQPQVTESIGDEVHQVLGPEPVEATADEDVHSMEGNPSMATSSSPAPDVATSSTQASEEEGVVPMIGPGSQLQAYNLELPG
jgi:hypothetical protein